MYRPIFSLFCFTHNYRPIATELFEYMLIFRLMNQPKDDDGKIILIYASFAPVYKPLIYTYIVSVILPQYSVY